MNRSETAEAMKVMQHYVDGGEVESKRFEIGNFYLNKNPAWKWEQFSYRPLKHSGECEAAIDIEGRLVSNPGGSGPSGTFRIKWEEI